MRIAFLGTPEFAVLPLRALYDNGQDLCVFTQPDKPVGRKAILTPPPVKSWAIEHGIPVYQFDRIKSAEGMQAIRDFEPDLLVTAAFGQLLSQEILDIAPFGCINVHGSLLPKYRGASPIQAALINGEAVTGITTMLTDIGMDTGAILLKAETPVLPSENAEELSERLSAIGADLLLETIERYCIQKTLVPVPQDEAAATKCSMLRKEDGRLMFTLPAAAVHDRIRGVNPWPGAYALLPDGTAMKFWKSSVTPLSDDSVPGTICVLNGKMHLRCADTLLEILEVQAPGGKRMDGAAFLRGKPQFIGLVLQ